MEPHRRRVRHRLLAGLLAVLAVGGFWSATEASTSPASPLTRPLTSTLTATLTGAVRTLAREAQDAAGHVDHALPLERRDEGRYGRLRGDRFENLAVARSTSERGPRPADGAAEAALAAGLALVVLVHRARRRRTPAGRAGAGTSSRGPPLLTA